MRCRRLVNAQRSENDSEVVTDVKKNHRNDVV